MKFLVDAPLGGLAKWLRFCGFDAALLRLAAAPGAWPPPEAGVYILTRREAATRPRRPDLLVLAAADSQSQLEEVFRRLKIDPDQLRPLSRCGHCNALLVPLERDQAGGRVPEHVFHYFRQFFECPRCLRVYWPGSHLQGLSRKMQELLEQVRPHP